MITKQKTTGDLKTFEKVLSQETKAVQITRNIRNPLTAISLANHFIKEIAEENSPKESVELLTDIIARNTANIANMLNDLLKENAEDGEAFIHADVGDIIDNSLHKAAHLVRLKKIHIYKSYSSGIVIHGNPQRLTEAFINVIIHAAKSIHGEEGLLWIRVTQANDNVKIIFKSDGHSNHPQVTFFQDDENFSQPIPATAEEFGHIKELLDGHDAALTVTNQADTGTSVILNFKV